MIRYLDTSVVVAACSVEPRSDEIQRWLSEQKPGETAISEWVVTEFSAALSFKLRTRQINADDRAAALALFARLKGDGFTMLPVTPQTFQAAARFADHSTSSLRAGDALHLAIAAEHGATLCTLDKRLGAATIASGVKAHRF